VIEQVYPQIKWNEERLHVYQLTLREVEELPTSRPIYIYGVNNLKAMLDNLTMVTENKTYIVKALPNNTMKIMPNTPETYIFIIIIYLFIAFLQSTQDT
jgi:hypothetical protein